MIDNSAAAMDLLDKLQAALPVPARLTSEVRASLASKNARTQERRCRRTGPSLRIPTKSAGDSCVMSATCSD